MTITTGPALQAEPSSTPSALWYRWLGSGLLGLAIGISVNSVLGPLFADVIDYPLTERGSTRRGAWKPSPSRPSRRGASPTASLLFAATAPRRSSRSLQRSMAPTCPCST
jgi:hypothetical protein